MMVYAIYWTGLFLPCAVMVLPAFQTTFTEDVLVGAAFVYLLLRYVNDDRMAIPPPFQPVFYAGFLSLIYGILWLGLVRGYYETYGKALIALPMLLILVLVLDYPVRHKESKPHNRLCSTLLIANLVLFIVLIVWGRMIHRDANPYYQAVKHFLVPTLSVLPVVSLAVLHAPRFPSLQDARSHLLLLLPLFLLCIVAWSGNAYTWALWYTAGKLEREWTPFYYDKASQPALYAEANRKPYDAARYYMLVKERLQNKGEISEYWNWDFFMQYRMAYQARRLKEASRCLAWLPPERAETDFQIQTLQTLWNEEFLWDMQQHTDMFDSPQSFVVDAEWDARTNQAFVMDLFGRVFVYEEEWLQPVWKPDMDVTNAVDLEVTQHGFTVLLEDGLILFEKEQPYWSTLHLRIPKPHFALDMEWLSPNACIVMTDFGWLHFVGDVPQTIPREQAFNFGKRLAADFEVDPDGKGLYVLDVYGGIHSSHAEGESSLPHKPPMVDESLLPYWLNQNVAVDMELDDVNEAIYIYNRMGELFPVTANPFRETYHPNEKARFRGVAITLDSESKILALESNGNMISIP